MHFRRRNEARKHGHGLKKADFEHAMRRLFETKKIVAQPYGAPSKDVSRLVAL